LGQLVQIDLDAWHAGASVTLGTYPTGCDPGPNCAMKNRATGAARWPAARLAATLMGMSARTCFPVALLLTAAAGCGQDIPVFHTNAFSSDPMPVGVARGQMVTTNNGEDTLSVIDPAGHREVGRIPVGFIPAELEGPHHVACDPMGRFILVNLSEAVAGSGSGPHGAHGTGTMPGYLLKVDPSNGRTVAFLGVDPNPGDNTINSDGSRAFVTHFNLNQWIAARDIRAADARLYVVDTASMNWVARVPICPAAHGVRLSHDEKTVYATCAPSEIAVVDLTSSSYPVRRVTLPGHTETLGSCDRCPYAIGVAPDSRVWVSSLGETNGAQNGGLDIYDPATGQFLQTGGFPANYLGGAMFAAFSHKLTAAGGFTAYVPEQGIDGDRIHVYTVASPGAMPTASASIELPRSACFNAHIMSISDDDATGYVVCEGDHMNPGTFVFVDLATGHVSLSLPIGVFPDGLGEMPH
jgi:DNA-binding beta-propeller fold protein YncE